MEMEGTLIQPDKSSILNIFHSQQTVRQQIKLHLLINFNEQWESFKLGRIKFGLKGGELKLKLQNSEMPYEARQLAAPLTVHILKERQEQKSSTNKIGVEPSAASGKAGVKVNLGTEGTENITDKFPITDYQISLKGNNENPAWSFQVETGEPLLKGLLEKTELGTLNVTGKPCYVEATFEVSRSDIKVVLGEGIWNKNLIPEKREALEIKFIKLLLNKKLGSYLSRVKLQYV
jgi:hypothetical protein